MSDSGESDIWEAFNKLWAEARADIFRLQLLNTYKVIGEEEQLSRYLNGQNVNLENDPDNKKWVDSIMKKRKENVRNVNLVVTDLPLSDYTKFVIDVHYIKQALAGREILFLDRKNVGSLVSGYADYWEFDSKTVMPMKYDNEGHFLGSGSLITNLADVARYTALKNTLLGLATSMNEFLLVNNIDLSQPKSKG